jgi:uncharacterized protein (DUF2336 family)
MPTNTLEQSVIEELEATFRSGTTEKQMETLMRVTDLFEGGASQYTDKVIGVFDDVIGHLIKHVESRALLELSVRLAAIPNAPADIVRRLARDDAIEIAGPMLAKSERLTDSDLVAIAETKSQAHLAKIASRPHLHESVTEVLVDRGDDHVAHTVASNPGARFSRTGLAKLVIRAEGNERLTESVARRADIPPALFRQLLIQATEVVRERLLASARPQDVEIIRKVMTDLAEQAGRKKTETRNYADVRYAISSFSQDTDLLKRKIMEFSDADRHAEAIVSLSALSGVPVTEVDKMFYSSNELALTVLCRAVGLDFDTAYAVLAASRGGQDAHDLEVFTEFCRSYDELSAASAQRILHFWLGRQKVSRFFKQNVA